MCLPHIRASIGATFPPQVAALDGAVSIRPLVVRGRTTAEGIKALGLKSGFILSPSVRCAPPPLPFLSFWFRSKPRVPLVGMTNEISQFQWPEETRGVGGWVAMVLVI